MKSISRTITHPAGDILGLKERTNFRSRSEWVQFIGDIPNEDYRVVYQLDQEGELEGAALPGYMGVSKVGDPYTKEAVCFIPKTWLGKRISRRVLPL